MNQRESITQRILEEKVISIIRLKDGSLAEPIAKAIFSGGLSAIEITMNTPGALKSIETLAKEEPNMLIGAGSVVDAKTAAECVGAGAKYLVTPATQKEVIEKANELDVPVVSGAFTPTEALDAYKLGCHLIKIFPAEFLGPGYIKAMKAPMEYLDLVPTGGVTHENITEWFANGASAVGIGSSMFKGFDLEKKNFERITENAESFSKAIGHLH